MRLLVIAPFLPHARSEHGGGTYLHALLEALAEQAEVDLVACATPAELAARAHPCPGLRRTLLVTRPDRCDDHGLAGLRRRAAMLRRFTTGGLPVVIAKFALPTLAAVVRHALRRRADYDAVLHEMDLTAWLLPADRPDRPRRPLRVLTDHEGGHAVAARVGPGSLGLRRDRRLWERYVDEWFPRADLLQALTQEDADRLATRLGREVALRPAVVRTPTQPTDLGRAGPHALFFGDFRHLPNPETARFLIQEVVPLLRSSPASPRLRIAGRGSRAALPGVPPDVEVLDFVADLAPLLADTRVVVAPAFSGGGTRIKLLTALAHGVPVVTNQRGGQGLPAGPEGGVLRAETAAEIAELTARCLRDPDAALAAAARRSHLEHNTPAAAARAQLDLLRAALDAQRSD